MSTNPRPRRFHPDEEFIVRRNRLRQRQRRIQLQALGIIAASICGLSWWQARTSSPATQRAISPIQPVQAATAPSPSPTVTPTPTPRSGVAIPKWAQGEEIHKVRLKPGRKLFALTFDDGPWPHETAKILEILDQFNVKATFFMVGREVARRPKIAQAVRDAGHAIGNHSWDHPNHPRSPVSQVVNTDNTLKKYLGFEPTLFRPPYGNMRNGMAKRAMSEKDAVVLWSADSYDWKRPGASVIANRVLRAARPGGIALMHDGGGNRSQTIAALPTIISTLQQRGYTLVTVPELLAERYVAPKPRSKTVLVKGKAHHKNKAKSRLVAKTHHKPTVNTAMMNTSGAKASAPVKAPVLSTAPTKHGNSSPKPAVEVRSY